MLEAFLIVSIERNFGHGTIRKQVFISRILELSQIFKNAFPQVRVKVGKEYVNTLTSIY